MMRLLLFSSLLLSVSCSTALSSDEGREGRDALEGEGLKQNENVEFIDQYLKNHSDAVELPSGVIYRALKSGPEGSPEVENERACLLRYVGKTIHEEMFISSRQRGANPSEITPSRLKLPGWREALLKMKEGDHWEVVLPVQMGYGGKTKGKYVKEDSTLIFDMEVVQASASIRFAFFSKHTAGFIFMIAYAIYMYISNKKEMKRVEAVPSLSLIDVQNNPEHPIVFLEVSLRGQPLDRIEIELFSTVCPKTAENFRCLCTGEKGMCKSIRNVVPLHFKGSTFHRVIKGFMCQGGDITNLDGSGGESIYGKMFPDEFEQGAILHSDSFLLSMANCGPDTNGSQFFITVKPTPWLDKKHVVFGRVISGIESVKAMNDAGSMEGTPSAEIRITNCGEIDRLKSKTS